MKKDAANQNRQRYHAWQEKELHYEDAYHFLTQKPVFSPEQIKKLEALSALFDESLPGHRILKTEIARELGKFDECLLLLSYQFEEGYDWTIGYIRKLAE